MTSPLPQTKFTLLLAVDVDLSFYWELETRGDGVTVARNKDRIFDRCPDMEIPYTEAEALHGIREELMGTVNGWPFVVTGVEQVQA